MNLLLLLFLVLTVVFAVGKEQSFFPLSIIHINDFHSRFSEINTESSTCKKNLEQTCIGGYARVVTAVKNLFEKKNIENKNPIYLNIGDNFQGTLWYDQFGWNMTTYFLNMLNANGTTLGNHEFERGIPEVVNFLKTLNSDVIVSNFDDSEEPDLKNLYKKSKILEINGHKIGLIGVLSKATKNLGANIGNLKILDEIESVKKESERLRNEENVNIIIVLSHCGLSTDRRMAREGGSAIDVIVGGHTHDLLYNSDGIHVPGKIAGPYPIVHKQDDGHKVLIVQASEYSKYVGDLTVYFDESGEPDHWEGNTIFLDSSITPDRKVEEELKPWREQIETIAQREIGSTKVFLEAKSCVFGECTMGNFVTDAYVDYFISHPEFQPEEGAWTYATIAFSTSGGFRTGLLPGSINYDDLYTAFPFNDRVDVFELQGKDIKDILEYSAKRIKTISFLQFSGLKVVYLRNMTNTSENRVASISVLCRVCDVPKYEPLDEDLLYRIVAPEFIASGKAGGYDWFKNSRHYTYRRGDMNDTDLIERYIKKMSPIQYKQDGRIEVINMN